MYKFQMSSNQHSLKVAMDSGLWNFRLCQFQLMDDDYFHELCMDLNYIAPVDVVVGSEIEVP